MSTARGCSITAINRGRYHLVLNPQLPWWAAVNEPGARLVADLARSGGDAAEAWATDLASRNGLSLEQAGEIVRGCAAETLQVWQPAVDGEYRGRAAYLCPRRLRELWFHINNRCNFACRHCLVSSGPNRDDGLPEETVAGLVRDARELGVITFFFTGGEPLLRPDLPRLLGLILDDPEAHAVVLTNGSLLGDEFLEAVSGLDRQRLHLQVSLDGSTAELNDALRSPGGFARTTAGIRRALEAGLDATVATVVLERNLQDLPALAHLLAELGIGAWHLMWQHLRERGNAEPAATVERITEAVLDLKTVADAAGVTIDNFETFEAIINGEPGTKRDGTNACWDSLAIHADGCVYPSASLVGIEEFRGGSVLSSPLEDVWLGSPVFEDYRRRSALDCSSLEEDPFLLLHGGGDPEHAYFHGGGKWCARDPYVPLYVAMMLRVVDEIVEERLRLYGAREGYPFVYHVMGQDGLGCPVDAGVENDGPHRLDFMHSNCVLIQDVVGHSREIVREFYAEAAVEAKGEICCPVPVDRRYFDHIPRAVLERSYGCGSPIFAADLAEGEVVVDLGSGGGIECFAAARMVGPSGLVVGVDMTPEMLELASGARAEVAARLGYDNVRFVQGYLEALPLRDDFADVVTSNCVINLSPQKNRVFAEILRILKPGGRMVISDVTAGDEVPEDVRFNPRLRDECVGGALRHDELLRLLTKLGFTDLRLVGRLPWREVEGVTFFADTVGAVKPQPGHTPPPYVGVEAAEGYASAPRAAPATARAAGAAAGLAYSEAEGRHLAGCLVCGAALQYLQTPVEAHCAVCGRELRTRARCAEGHFVCDQCHGGDYLQFLRAYLAQCEGTDPVAVFLDLRRAYPFPVHGPEHHALVPAAFLIAHHNRHGYPDLEALWQAVLIAADLPGGTCAFWGACSAALGIGVACSTILDATPLTGKPRCDVQGLVAIILERIGRIGAPRCCRRESLISLLAACELSGEVLPRPIETSGETTCDQAWANRECIGEACAFARSRREATQEPG